MPIFRWSCKKIATGNNVKKTDEISYEKKKTTPSVYKRMLEICLNLNVSIY
jgi:hypothetical protein